MTGQEYEEFMRTLLKGVGIKQMKIGRTRKSDLTAEEVRFSSFSRFSEFTSPRPPPRPAPRDFSGRRGSQMVSALCGVWIEWSGIEPWPWSCVAFLEKILYSHSAFLLSTREYKWVPVNCQENLSKWLGKLRWTSIPSRRSSYTPSSSMPQNPDEALTPGSCGTLGEDPTVLLYLLTTYLFCK